MDKAHDLDAQEQIRGVRASALSPTNQGVIASSDESKRTKLVNHNHKELAMSKEQVVVIVVLLVSCVVVGLLMDSTAIAQAMAPIGEGVSKFAHHLNTIQ